ncbi:hypothetical protein LSH36_67g06071 [Paralvinella palmiformis]|uniref:Prominin-like protein n=1 Tax=Paralvinella palmiformis TaxID=53620 RepID=A0AAD9NEI3_9ANNE|nr:hypothetical protein LSH36_67g06071 [Paralvinella palmiformis]
MLKKRSFRRCPLAIQFRVYVYHRSDSFLAQGLRRIRGCWDVYCALFSQEWLLGARTGNYDAVTTIVSDWHTWADHYLGFVICAAVGAAFIILMPLVGLCFCCCRCCGNCGAETDKEEKKSDKCKRGVCATFLLIFILILLAGMVCGFVTNELLREQSAKDDDHSLLTRVTTEMNSLEAFKTNTVKDFKNRILDRMNRTALKVMNKIQDAADSAKDSLGNVTDSADMLNKAMHLAKSAEKINQTMTDVRDVTNLLVMDQGRLISNLSNVKYGLEQILDNCPEQACSDLKLKIQKLAVGPDFTKVDDISQKLGNVSKVLGNNLTYLIDEGKEEYEDIASRVQTNIKQEMTRAKNEVSKVTDEVKEKVTKITEDLQKIRLNDTVASIKSLQDTVDQYGNYRYYGGMVLCCILLLVVLFGLLGLCFGVCGDPAGEDAPACNRGVGATILMFGVGLCFLFGWIIMILVLILFLGGGLSYTEVCRYAINLPEAPQDIQNLTNEILSVEFEKLGLNVQATDIIRDCEQNKGIYKSLKLEQVVNISSVLNLDNYDIKQKIEELTNSVNVDLSDVIIFSNYTRDELNKLKDAALNAINFTSYQKQLEKPLTIQNLTEIITEIEQTADELVPANQDLASAVRSYADALLDVQNSTIGAMSLHKNRLATEIDALKDAVDGPPSINEDIDDLIDSLEKAQVRIQKNGTILIKKIKKLNCFQFIGEHGNEILVLLRQDLKELDSQVENDIGRCQPVHRSLTNVLKAGCVSLLDPFNGFWFSIGMSLFCFIPFIITSVVLVGLYRKTDEFYDDKSFDDVNYDAYTGMYPGDNIPLEDLRPKKSQPNSGGLPDPAALYGIRNPGYITDGFPNAPPASDNVPRNRESPPQYGSRGYGDMSHPIGGSYPSGDYTIPVSARPYSPPHYNNK